jgi:hypothetical protein
MSAENFKFTSLPAVYTSQSGFRKEAKICQTAQIEIKKKNQNI